MSKQDRENYGAGSLATFLMQIFKPKPTYQGYIRSAAWREKANAAKKRAGYRCQVCNSKTDLQAHHRTYERLYREKAGDITVLCAKCHKLFSDNGRLSHD